MKSVCFALCIAAAAPALASAAPPAAAPVARGEDLDAEFQAMTQPFMDFLNLITRRFPERECVRDRSLLNAEYGKIELSLQQMFVVRDDLRKDVREIAMRLATFQPLPAELRHRDIPLALPPKTESEKAMIARVVQARTALWKKLDALESRFPASAAALASKEMGFIITVDDRGWRPGSPGQVLNERKQCGSD
ncbi:MAG TPA: hypothetical protein VGB57_07905 [Allosphingosinicella sp.]|jgi:hypothetical protein